MNGTERYYNDRIQEGGGNVLLRYDPISWKVTHAPLETMLVVSAGRTNQTMAAENEALHLTETVGLATAFTVTGAGTSLTCNTKGTYYIKVWLNVFSTVSTSARFTACIYVNGVKRAPIRLTAVIQGGLLTLIYYFDVGDVFSVVAENFSNMAALPYYGGIQVMRVA